MMQKFFANHLDVNFPEDLPEKFRRQNHFFYKNRLHDSPDRYPPPRIHKHSITLYFTALTTDSIYSMF